MQKVDEPRTLVKVSVSQRERIRKGAKRLDISMMNFIEEGIRKMEADAR
jgi:hypothetical protein